MTTEQKAIQDLVSLDNGVYRMLGAYRTDIFAKLHSKFTNWYSKTFNAKSVEPWRKSSPGYITVSDTAYSKSFLFTNSRYTHNKLNPIRAFNIVITDNKYTMFMEACVVMFMMWDGVTRNDKEQYQRGVDRIHFMHNGLSYLFNQS